MPSVRIYLSERERELADERAALECTSLSFLARTGLRLVLGLPVPPALRPAPPEAESGADRRPDR